jgi:predicted nucleotide-binding protein
MSVIHALESGHVGKGDDPVALRLREDIEEQVDKAVQIFASRVRYHAAKQGLRAAHLSLFEADHLYVVRGTGLYYMVFVLSERPRGGEIYYLDWLFDDIPSVDYVANSVTFDYGEAVCSVVLTDDELEGTDFYRPIDKAAEAYVNVALVSHSSAQLTTGPSSGTSSRERSNRIFVVHGHDDGMKETVAGVLKALGLIPVILHKHPNEGKTIIEKFTEYSDVGYAVALLSPDDSAFPKGQSPKLARPRARQNVIFEMGYFIGKLGRENVAALHRVEPNFEMPSDYSGVLFIPYDSGGWKLALVDELKARGYKISADDLSEKRQE